MLHLYDLKGPMINFEHKAAVKYKFEGEKSYKFKDKIKELASKSISDSNQDNIKISLNNASGD